MSEVHIESDVITEWLDQYGDESPAVLAVYKGKVVALSTNTFPEGAVFVGVLSEELVAQVEAQWSRVHPDAFLGPEA